MKCAKENCEKTVPPLQKYCSRDHAPFGHLAGRSSRTPSVYQTAPSGMPAPTDPSKASSPSAKPTEIEKDRSGLTEWLQVDPDPGAKEGQPLKNEPTKNHAKESENLEMRTERLGTAGTSETRTNIVPLNADEETPEAQTGLSEGQQSSLRQARLRSLNSIDSSVELLIGFMKSQVSELSKGETIVDFRQINAVANLGKQVASLAKVKLDAIREVRKADKK